MKWLKRIFISIAVIIALYIGAVWGLSSWLEYHEKHYFQDRDRIERITGVKVPKFKVMEYSEGSGGRLFEYNDDFTFEFKTVPSDELFDEIDKKIEDGHTRWIKEGNKYSFFQTWGNGFPVPKGERDDADRFFSITISRGEKQGTINHGIRIRL